MCLEPEVQALHINIPTWLYLAVREMNIMHGRSE